MRRASDLPKPEQACWHAEDCEESRYETVLLCSETVLYNIRLQIPVDVADVDDDTDNAPDGNADENDAKLAEIESIFVNVG